MKDLRILMLEDLEEDAALIERVMKRQGMKFVSKRVDAREEFHDALTSFQPEVILSDHSLPQFNSLDALQICSSMELNVPFILVTGTVSEEFAVNCLKQGADDYVLKSNLVRLPTAITNALKQRQHAEVRRRADLALKEQNDELVKINRELDSFVYSVSHNLRAPLMSVLGLVNIVSIENKPDQNGINRYLEMISESIHKLDDTLKEILDYSRNARSELNFETLDLQELIDSSFLRLAYIDGSQSITKRVEVAGSVKFVCDRYRISVILNNLISNAIKYHDPQKESFINVSATVNEEEAKIEIVDNGIGIPEELQRRVFDMFFRATEKSEGAGLGLYIVRETVEKLSGTITVESHFAKGSRFTLRIPNASGK